jgi:general secretion pathway protein A
MSIYLQHFALQQEPFSIVPDPGFLYPSHQHRQAVAHLKYGLDREGGFILLTGEVGTGKTTLTRTMLQRIPAHVRVAYVLNSKLNETDLLASICDELEISLPKAVDLSFSKICIDALNHNLLESHAEGKKTLIVIEEAQNLSDEVLETLRLLSNLETNTHKLLHILLVGQPELVKILGKQNLRQLNQRVVSRFHLLPIDKAEVSNYINHRLHHAGASGALFDAKSINIIYRLTKGVPRLINLICHQALLAAYSLGLKSISASLVRDAASEILEGLETSPSYRKRILILLLIGFLGAAIFTITSQKHPFSDHINLYFSKSEIENSAKDVILGDSQGPVESIPNNNIIEQSNPIQIDAEGNSGNLLVTSDINEVKLLKPFDSLLELWGLRSSEIYTFDEFSAFALDSGLRVERIGDGTINNLVTIDRPGLALMKTDVGISRSRLVIGIEKGIVSLIVNGEVQNFDFETFTNLWSGSFVYLWRPPSAFEILQVDDVNQAAIIWLQDKLSLVNVSENRLITGGRYTAEVQAQIMQFQNQQNILSDGIVGRQTLMRLNQITDQNIPTLGINGS